jgi:hypothetical protein
MKNIRCPFCNLITTVKYNINIFLYVCNKHNNIEVVFDPIAKDFWLHNNLYWIHSDPETNTMNLSKEDSMIFETINLDPNLTPENFEEKLKTYLNFL